MSLRKNLRTWLLTQAALTALIGQRIHPQKRPGGDDDTLPCLVTIKKSASHGYALGDGNNDKRHTFHLVIVAEQYAQADAIYDVLAGSSGILNGVVNKTFDTQTVDSVVIDDDFDDADYDVLNSEQLTYMITVVVTIMTGNGS